MRAVLQIPPATRRFGVRRFPAALRRGKQSADIALCAGHSIARTLCGASALGDVELPGRRAAVQRAKPAAIEGQRGLIVEPLADQPHALAGSRLVGKLKRRVKRTWSAARVHTSRVAQTDDVRSSSPSSFRLHPSERLLRQKVLHHDHLANLPAAGLVRADRHPEPAQGSRERRVCVGFAPAIIFPLGSNLKGSSTTPLGVSVPPR